jgi:hypothetical protein
MKDQISGAGITGLQAMKVSEQRLLIAAAYAYGVWTILHGSTAFAAATFILSCFVGWRSVKDKPKDSEISNELTQE